MRERKHRLLLVGKLIGAGILVFPIPVLAWPGAVTSLARIGVIALTILFVSVLSVIPIAKYRRAIGKPLRLDRFLPGFD
jgi:hypothetical protein